MISEFPVYLSDMMRRDIISHGAVLNTAPPCMVRMEHEMEKHHGGFTYTWALTKTPPGYEPEIDWGDVPDI
jgi:hypothetical protein